MYLGNLVFAAFYCLFSAPTPVSSTTLVDLTSLFPNSSTSARHPLASAIPDTTKTISNAVTTLRNSYPARYPNCNEYQPEDVDDERWCYTQNSFIFAPPLSTSVACNSITYILNEPSQVSTALVTQLFTPMNNDSLRWDYYVSLHLTGYYDMEIHNDGSDECRRFGKFGEGGQEPSVEGLATNDDCEVHAWDVQLLYFAPQSHPVRDMCATEPLETIAYYGNASHVSQSVLDGVTLYGDRAYMSVKSIHAWTTIWSSKFYESSQGPEYENRTYWECKRTPYGKLIPATIIELQSHEVSSIRLPYTLNYPFNFADLVEPFPRSAWLGQGWHGRSSPYYFPPLEKVSTFQPMLVVPSHFKSMDPNWASCSGYFLGWRDPPRAFGPTSTLAMPTITAHRTPPPTQQQTSIWIGAEAAPGSTPTLPAKATSNNGNEAAETIVARPYEVSSNEPWRAAGAGSSQADNNLNFVSKTNYKGQFNTPNAGDQGADRNYMQSELSRNSANSLEKPSQVENVAAKSYWSSLLTQGQLATTSRDGQPISAENDGLVIGNAETGTITIPYSSLLVQSGGVTSTMGIGQVASLVEQAYKDLGSTISYNRFEPEATGLSSPGRHGRARNGGVDTMSQNPGLRYAAAAGFFLLWGFSIGASDLLH